MATGKEVFVELKQFAEDNNLEDDFNEFTHYRCEPSAELSNFRLPLELVAEDGCWSDGGQISVVIKIGDFFLKDVGYYSSWDSDQWENEWIEVEPVQVTVTQYHPVKGVAND